MTRTEFETFLESIGGLKNGYYTDREPIKSAGFFSIGSGWYMLVKTLIEEIIKLGWDKQMCQVKEKFGGLRFYVNAATPGVHELISKYERLSYYVCEECGTSHNVGQTASWIITLCESCKIKNHPDTIWEQHKTDFDKTDDVEFKKVFNIS